MNVPDPFDCAHCLGSPGACLAKALSSRRMPADFAALKKYWDANP
jgi:hypothetical protein